MGPDGKQLAHVQEGSVRSLFPIGVSTSSPRVRVQAGRWGLTFREPSTQFFNFICFYVKMPPGADASTLKLEAPSFSSSDLLPLTT